MSEQLKIGIVGLGHLHPRAYMFLFEACKFTQVISACDTNSELLKRFCDDYSLNGYGTLEEMICSDRPDVAAIFLPHSECAEAAVKCAEKGIHLMIEKPIAESSASVKKVIDAAEKHGVLVTTGYCWRYHPVIKEMKQVIDSGVLGEIVSVEARLAAGKVDRYIRGNSEWMLQKAKSGGGPMYNLGVHWIDILCYLLEDDINEVCASNYKVSTEYDIEDGSVAMLRFDSGVVGNLNVSYIVPESFPCGRDLYIGIKGTKGSASYCPKYEGEQGSSGSGQVDVLEVYSDSIEYAGASARKFCFELDKTSGYSGYMGKAYVDSFAKAILAHKQPDINGTQALKVLNVVEAIYASDEKKRWIKVNDV